MSQLIRLEGKHTAQTAQCAVEHFNSLNKSYRFIARFYLHLSDSVFQAELNSTAVSIFVDILVELTNTNKNSICQFNQYNNKY